MANHPARNLGLGEPYEFRATYYLRNNVPAQKTMLDFEEPMEKLEADAAKVPAPSNLVEVAPSREILAGRGDPEAPPLSKQQQADVNSFADDTEKLAKNWDTADPETTANKMRTLLNAQMSRDGVPAIGGNDDQPRGGIASFNAEGWSMSLNPKPFTSAGGLLGLAIEEKHESTHPIEDFDAARVSDPKEAHDAIGMSMSVAKQAHNLESSHPIGRR